jgi:hypothetical protein
MRTRVKAFDAPFVGITTTVLDSAAWKAMSPSARIVYIAIKRNYNHQANNNGRLYLAGRNGAKATGLSPNTVWRCVRELIHYGFAVVTRSATLGTNGHGRPTALRLTEMGTRADPLPTRDFLKWDGVLFDDGLTHGSRNLPQRPKDDQDGNGVPGRVVRLTKNRNPHQSVRQGAPIGEAGVHQSVRQSNPEVHQSVRHVEQATAPIGEANLVSATRVAWAGSKGRKEGQG